MRVYSQPNGPAVYVAIVGLLGSTAASLGEDPQADSPGERFRAVRTGVPTALVAQRISAEA